MKFDVLGLLAACSYALDCVEAELIKVQTIILNVWHIWRFVLLKKMGIQGQSLQDLAECALLHDNAVAHIFRKSFKNDALRNGVDEAGKALYL